MVPVTPECGRNHIRLPVDDIADMADQTFIQDRVYGVAVIMPTLVYPLDPVPFRDGKISHNRLLFCADKGVASGLG